MQIDGARVASTDKDIEAIAKLLSGCGAVQRNLGGNIIECEGGSVIVAAAGPPGAVELTVKR